MDIPDICHVRGAAKDTDLILGQGMLAGWTPYPQTRPGKFLISNMTHLAALVASSISDQDRP